MTKSQTRPAAKPSAKLPTAARTFRNPLKEEGADPWLLFYNDNYYLTRTTGEDIRICRAPTIAGLATAPDVVVWRDGTPSRRTQIWASEFHLLSGPDGPRWYLYYTASDGNDDHHRMHVLESAGTDPMGPYFYKAQMQTDAENRFYAIDGTVIKKPDGTLYFMWAGRPGHVLFIARMSNPWTVETERVHIPADGFGCPEVREGPVPLYRNGKIYLVYSMCDTGKPDYRLGMLIADETSDLLQPASWKQHPRPVFERADANGVYGPGHNSFFKSPDGTEDWIAYHGKISSAYTYGGRSTRVQKFTWRADGTPDFGVPLPLDRDIPVPSGEAAPAVKPVPAVKP